MPLELLQVFLDMQDQPQAIALASANAQMIGWVGPGVRVGAVAELNRSSLNAMNWMNSIPQMRNMNMSDDRKGADVFICGTRCFHFLLIDMLMMIVHCWCLDIFVNDDLVLFPSFFSFFFCYLNFLCNCVV